MLNILILRMNNNKIPIGSSDLFYEICENAELSLSDDDGDAPEEMSDTEN